MSARDSRPRIFEVHSEQHGAESRRQLNWIDKSMVQHAHPPKLILDTIAYMWALYFFWHQQWVPAVAILVVLGGLGSYLGLRQDLVALARTPVGNFFLVSAHPLNLILQVAGYTAVAFASWYHSTPLALGGVTLALLGHLSGWERFGKTI